MSWRILCDSAELAVECLQTAEALELDARPVLSADWFREAVDALVTGAHIGVCIADKVELAQLIELARAQPRGGLSSIALVGSRPDHMALLDVMGDLGMTALSEVGPLCSALAFCGAGVTAPWSASARALPVADRGRLSHVLSSATKAGGHLTRAQDAKIAWQPSLTGNPKTVLLGAARDVASAIAALRATDRKPARVELSVEGVDERAVLDVIFGPRRALSDPASKAALLPYGIPVPVEELCASPSRAAAEATRIGYPVRISLASPDLRIWDHPDLVVDMVDNAARVRDSFGQLMSLAAGRAPSSDRVLGAMVTATSHAVALLGVRATPQPQGMVAMTLGFADPHGSAAGDTTLAVVSAESISSIERALGRLRGSELILGGGSASRKAHLKSIGDLLLRLAAFVDDRRTDIESVELRPVALLLDGSVEVREACVSVSDAFERTLAAPPEVANSA